MICDWTDRTEYLCHLRSLKIYERYGKEVTKLKSVIKLEKNRELNNISMKILN